MRRTPVAVFTALLAFGGCASGPERNTRIAHAPPTAAPATTTNAAPLDESAIDCSEGAALVAPSEVELSCAHELADCAATFSVSVHNCGEAALGLIGLALVDGISEPSSSASQTWTPEQSALGPHRTWTQSLRVTSAGRFALQATVWRLGGARMTIAVPVVVHNRARETAMTACVACQGEWGGHGVANVEGCNCATHDAGHPCAAKSDCEGACIADHSERVRGRALPQGAPTCARGEQVFAFRGRCTDHRLVSGCHAVLEQPTFECRAPATATHLPTTCVD